MNSHRRAILQLVAMGRVTPVQAERLLIALNEGQQTVSILVACVAVAIVAQLHLEQLLPGMLHIAHLLASGSFGFLHRALPLITGIL